MSIINAIRNHVIDIMMMDKNNFVENFDKNKKEFLREEHKKL